MPVFVALLRAVNVGGTGKLPMSDLRALCTKAGFAGAVTYIQSGNVVFRSPLTEAKVRAKLEAALAARMGQPVGVLVRTGGELARVLRDNPFPEAPPNRVIVTFLGAPPPRGALAGVVAPGGERVKIDGREVFVHYPEGQGQSKLKIPFAKLGTGRNLNTVAALSGLAEEIATK